MRSMKRSTCGEALVKSRTRQLASGKRSFSAACHAVSVVPPDFFDSLVSALEAPAVPNPALARAALRADEILDR